MKLLLKKSSKQLAEGAGGVAEWQTACLESMKFWVPSQALQTTTKMKNLVEILECLGNEISPNKTKPNQTN